MKRKLMAGLLALVLACLAMGTAFASPGDLVLMGPDEDGNQQESVDGACVVGDVLYIKGNQAIYHWKQGDAEPAKFYDFAPEAAQPAEGDAEPASEPTAPAYDAWSFRYMANWNGKLVSAYAADGEIYELTADGPRPAGIKLDPTSLPGAKGELSDDFYLIDSILFVGDSLFAVARASENDWNTAFLCSVDTSSGKMTTLTPQQERVTAVVPYVDGKLLVAVDRSMTSGADNQYIQLQLWDIAGAKYDGAAYAPNESWNLGALAYDAASNNIYLGQGTNIMRCKWGEKAEPVNFLGREMYSSRAGSSMLGDKLVIPMYEGVILASVDPSLIPTTVLTVTGDWSSDQALSKFMELNPGVAVNRVDSNIYNIETLQTAIAAGNAPDIFRFSTGSELSQLYQKGYAADLSGYQELVDRAKTLYPQIQEAISQDGKLFAYPMQFSAGLWSYDPKALDALGLQFPETFPALLELMADWEDEYQDDAEGRPLIDTYMVEKTQMFYTILWQYVAQYSVPDAPITFNTPQFKEVMEALERSSIKQLTPEEQQAMWSTTREYVEPIIETYSGFWRGQYPKTMVMPPKLTASSESFASADVYAYIVNPQSKQLDLAVAYINYMAEHADAQQRYMMYPDLMEPIENKWYLESMESMAKQLEELEAKTVEASEKRDHEAQIEMLKKEMEDYERWRWEISPEGIAEYRALAPQVRVNSGDMFYGDSWSEMSKIIERYQQKQLSLDQMVRELDQKAQMIFLETR